MNRAEELDKIDKAIKDAEKSFQSIRANIDQITKEIGILTQQKKELEKNLEFHKRVGIIPIAHEYGKTKRELIKVINRLNLITSDRAKAIQGLDSTQEILVKLKRDQLKLSNSNTDNVIRGLFGAKRGKK